jgi:O-antigen/teichoic acid export membrane protein
MQSNKIQLLFGSIIDLLGIAVSILIGFVIPPIIFRFMSNEDYGVWQIILQGVGLLSIIDLGMGVIVTRKFAEKKFLDDEKEKNTFLSSVMLLQLFEVAFVFIGGGLFVLIWGDFQVLKDDYRIVYWVMVSWYAVRPVLFLADAALRGQTKIMIPNIASILNTTIVAVGLIIMLYFGVHFLSFPFSLILGGIISTSFSFFFFLPQLKTFKVNVSFINKNQIKQILKFSLLLGIGKVGFMLISSTDNLIIGNYLGAESVTLYVITLRIPFTLKMISGKITSNFLGYFTTLFDQNESSKTQSVYINLLKINLVFGLFFSIYAFCINKLFVGLWVGSDKYGGDVLTLIGSLLVLKEFLVSGVRGMITGHGEIRGDVLAVILESILNLILSFIFVKYIGLAGVLLGTFLSSFIAVIFTYYKLNQLTHTKTSFLLCSLFPVIIRQIPVIATLLLLNYYIPNSYHWFKIIAIGALGGLVLIINEITFLDKSYKKLLKEKIIQKITK